ncbi:hypothetical protein ES708_26206 [subsurface metagenome]
MHFPIGASSDGIPASLCSFLEGMLMHHLLVPAPILPRVNISIFVVLAEGQPLLEEIYQVRGSTINIYAHNRVQICPWAIFALDLFYGAPCPCRSPFHIRKCINVSWILASIVMVRNMYIVVRVNANRRVGLIFLHPNLIDGKLFLAE